MSEPLLSAFLAQFNTLSYNLLLLSRIHILLYFTKIFGLWSSVDAHATIEPMAFHALLSRIDPTKCYFFDFGLFFCLYKKSFLFI